MRSTSIRFIVPALLATLVASGAAAGPLACTDDCEVIATSAGYVAPVEIIASGTTVTFRSVDAPHPTADSNNFDQNCFFLGLPGGGEASVRLKIVNDELRATTAPGTPDAETRPCGTATAIDTGSFLLTYQCLLHPQMHGALLIEP